MTRFLPLLCLLGVAACAPSAADVARSDARAATDRAKLDRALAGYVAGPPQTCLTANDRRVASVSNYGSTSLYRVSSGLIYRNDMDGNCPLDQQDAYLVSVTPSGQLCRGDIGQLVQRISNFPTGSCVFGDFVPYRRAR